MSINRKKLMSISIILVTLLTIILGSASAETTGGTAVDVLIVFSDSMLDQLTELFPKDSYSTSEESILGKKGTVFVDIDENKIRMVGDDCYRTYSFTNKDTFTGFTVLVVYAIDNQNLLKHDVNDYTQNGKTKIVTEEEISSIAAQFATFIN